MLRQVGSIRSWVLGGRLAGGQQVSTHNGTKQAIEGELDPSLRADKFWREMAT